jgi:hypothetical protein
MGRPERASKPSVEETPPSSRGEGELFDVPATVVCAMCGDPDCPGCAEERSRSGIVAIVAWEREGRLFSRMWSTAHAATINAEAFFESLPDGPVAPALRFAAVSELFAASSLALFLLAGLSAIAPLWLRDVFLDPVARGTAFRVAFLAIPGLATMLVAAHAAHGYALDIGARRSGAKPQGTRALRFGLYATGWDVVLGPTGFIVLAVKDGLGKAMKLGAIGMGLPTRSTLAFLKGAYNLRGDEAKPALRASYFAAIVATLVCAVIIAGMGLFVLFF